MTTATATRRTETARALADTAVELGVRAAQLRTLLANADPQVRARSVELRSELAALTTGARRPDEATWAETAALLHERESKVCDGWCPHCQEPIRRLPDQISLDEVLLDPLPHPDGDLRIVDVAGYVRVQRDRDRRTGRAVRYRRHERTCPSWPARPGTCRVCGSRLHQLLIDDGIDVHVLCDEGSA